jgi:adenylosuccinate synthase
LGPTERAFLVAGLGFGDEGKGSVVDWLVRRHRATLVVRYNGGPQAAHHVVRPGGLVHCFAQLGAGSLVPGVRTFLSRYMLVDPLALHAEGSALGRISLEEVWSRLFIDPRCIVVTPFHRLLNQMREVARGDARHGSCGRGVAEAQLDSERGGLPVVRMGDLRDPARLYTTLRLLWQVKVDQAEQLVEQCFAQQEDRPLGGARLRALLEDLRQPHRVEALCDSFVALVRDRGITLTAEPPPARSVVFEGAQGVLLDREHGFFPFVTPSRTTFANALLLLDDWVPRAERIRVGVLRAYATRHGAGPLPTEDRELAARLPDAHNGMDLWQGDFRVGWFDAVLGRHALRSAGGVDALVLTCLDRLAGLGPLRLADAYAEAQEGAPELSEVSWPGVTLWREIPRVRPEHAARMALSARLSELRPRYKRLAGWDGPGLTGPALAYVKKAAASLGATVTVSAVSLGPTAEDKQLLGSRPIL